MLRKKAVVLTVVITAVSGFAVLTRKNAEAKPKSPTMSQADTEEPSDETPFHNAAADKMAGFYVGQFGPNKITVCIQKVIGTSVNGYSVVSGNERAFSGSFKDEAGVMKFDVKEPSTDPYDGEFRFQLNPDQPPKLVGTWTPYDKKLAKVPFELVKHQFKYNPKAGKYPQSSTKRLTEKDVSNMRQEELRIMRNEMYARHGYSFKLKDMRHYFDKQDWYMPMSSDVSAQLTELEKKNEQLIKRYENYSAEYYDAFGR